MVVTQRRRFVLTAAVGATGWALGCGGKRAESEIPGDAKRTVLSLRELECENCGDNASDALRAEAGVYAVEFDKQRAEATVHHADDVTVDRLVAAVRKAGFDAREGPGAGEYVGITRFPPELDVATIGEGGESIDIDRQLVAGKVTVFDFFAVWCGPCKKVDRHMLAVLKAAPDVALRKIDVVDWDSAIAARYLADVPNLPFVVVYGVDGRRVAEISGLDLQALDAAIAKGRGA